MINNSILNTLMNAKLFRGLGEADLIEILRVAGFAERKFSQKQIIVNQGDAVSSIGILHKGAVFSTKYHFNGNEQILRIYRQGQVFSLDAVSTPLSTSPVTIISQSDSCVLFIPYRRIFDSRDLGGGIKERILFNSGEILGNELIRLMYKIDVLSKRTLRERILTYLSLIREKNSSDTFEIDMNQEQLAQYLCVNRSALSKELNQMRKSGEIQYRGKRFTLLDAAGEIEKILK